MNNEATAIGVTLEEKDLTLEGVYFSDVHEVAAVAFFIKPEKLVSRFGMQIEEYNNITGGDNSCILLMEFGYISNDIPTFTELLVILDQHKEGWFDGDWFEDRRFIMAQLHDSEGFFIDHADHEFEKAYGKNMNSSLEPFTDFYKFMKNFN